MQIVVIGAGIAGLGAATALAQDGHKVIILEKSNMKAEIGAAIHLGANAAGIAMSWGMDPKRVRSVKNTGYCEKSSNNEVLIKQEFDIETAFGAPWLLNHRVDLHNELKRLAIAAGAELRLGVQIDSIDCTGAKVTLKDGTVVEGDCVIGADGIHSQTRTAVLGKEVKHAVSGHSAYRLLIDAEKVRADPELEDTVTEPGQLTTWLAGDRRIVVYPCRDMTLLNMVAPIPDSCLHEDSTTKEEKIWANQGSLEHLKESFKDFHPAVLRLLDMADSCGLWQLTVLPILDTWVNGNTCLIGDACHAMLPHQGQGGGQAIEDVEALAFVFKNVDRSGVNEALQLYEKIRKERAEKVQFYSNEKAIGKHAVGDNNAVSKPLNVSEFVPYLFGYKGAEDWAKRNNIQIPVKA